MLYPTTCVGLRYGCRARSGCLADFLGSLITLAVGSPGGSPYCQVRLGRRTFLPPSAPTPFNALFRQCAEVPLLRPRVAARGSDGILTVSAIGLAIRLILRSRLTPGRLALPGKPRSCGGGVSHTPYRYLYLHLLFRTLQRGSPRAFRACGMLPYRLRENRSPAASAACFTPDYYPCGTP